MQLRLRKENKKEKKELIAVSTFQGSHLQREDWGNL